MKLPSAPAQGDVVVALETGDARRLYVLRIVPDAPQLGYTTRTAATTKARAFAERLGVDVWESSGAGYRLLARLRHSAAAAHAS